MNTTKQITRTTHILYSLYLIISLTVCGATAHATVLVYSDYTNLSASLVNPLTEFRENLNSDGVTVGGSPLIQSPGVAGGAIFNWQFDNPINAIEISLDSFIPPEITQLYGSYFPTEFELILEFFDVDGNSVGIFDINNPAADVRYASPTSTQPDVVVIDPCTQDCGGFNKPGSPYPTDSGDTGSDTGGTGSAFIPYSLSYTAGFVTDVDFASISLFSSVTSSGEPFPFSTSIGTSLDKLGSVQFPGNNTTTDSVSVPEPGIIALLGIGLIGLGFVRRRRMV